MKINKTAVINFRVTPEDKRNLDKLAAELCTNKPETLRFMLQYFSEMETDGVTAAKARLEMKKLISVPPALRSIGSLSTTVCTVSGQNLS